MILLIYQLFIKIIGLRLSWSFQYVLFYSHVIIIKQTYTSYKFFDFCSTGQNL